jgi:hypothetical protein
MSVSGGVSIRMKRRFFALLALLAFALAACAPPGGSSEPTATETPAAQATPTPQVY